MATVQKRKYSSVPAFSSDEISHIVPNGKKFYISEFGLSGGSGPNTKIELSFGDEIISSTHGDFYCNNQRIELIGDGEKELKIKMTNASVEPETMGGFFYGEEF